MKSFIQKIIKYSIVFIALFLVLGYFLEHQFSKNVSNKIFWMRSIKGDHFDYAFLGSSRVKNMTDINYMDSVLAKKGMNLGLNGSNYRTSYMLLHSFIEIQKNNIDEILIQVDPFMLYTNQVHERPKYDHFFYSIAEDKTIEKSLGNSNNLFFYKNFPIVKHIEYNQVYNFSFFKNSFSSQSIFDKSKGSELVYNHSPFHYTIDEDSKYTINHDFEEEDLLYLHKILDYCSQRNIKTTLYAPPVYEYDIIFKKQFPKYDLKIRELAKKSNLDYYDFMNHPYNDTYFINLTHLNSKGSTDFTKLLIQKMN